MNIINLAVQLIHLHLSLTQNLSIKEELIQQSHKDINVRNAEK